MIDKTQLYGPITSHDEVLTTNSSAFSFNPNGLVDMSMPKSLVLTKLDGIMSFGPWFTGGHNETGGDDSITQVPVRKKIMLIATRGRASRRLEALVKSSKSMIDLLSKPPAPQWKKSVKFYISDPTSLLIQPVLCTHAVIIFIKGPALVVGFEGIINSDDKRRQQVLSYYSSGVGQNKSQVWLDVAPDKTVLGKIRDCTSRTTALQEHLERLQHDRRPNCARKNRIDLRVPNRVQKRLFIGRSRRKVVLKKAESR